MTDFQFWVNVSVAALAALGTIGAVFAALFGNILRVKWCPPILHVELRTPAGELTKLTNASTKAHVDDIRYYHVQVSNSRRWSSASNLDLRLVQVEEQGPDGQFQMIWRGDIPIGCRDQAIYSLRHIVGSRIDFDICSVRKELGTLELHPIIAPNNLQTLMKGPRHIILSLQVKSAEIDSDISRFQIDWDGQWHEGDLEMQNHFKIKKLPSAPQSR